MKVNINARTRAVLTQKGVAVYADYHRKYLTGPPDQHLTLDPDRLDKRPVTFHGPLWELMAIFGPSSFMGSEICFEKNVIELFDETMDGPAQMPVPAAPTVPSVADLEAENLRLFTELEETDADNANLKMRIERLVDGRENEQLRARCLDLEAESLSLSADLEAAKAQHLIDIQTIRQLAGLL